jgi:hypothetical protein
MNGNYNKNNKKRKTYDEKLQIQNDLNGSIQNQIIDQVNDSSCNSNLKFDYTMIPNDIYIHIISKYLTDQDHVHLCCTNQYQYQYWSTKKHLQQTYNEDVLINKKYRQSIFRQQVRLIQCTADQILPTEIFDNTSITHLTFGHDYNQLTNHLPSSITHLTFGWSYDQLTNHLPLSVKHLTFGEHYNQPTDRLPSSITHLTFRYYYNQPTNQLPSSITHLTFGYEYDQPTDHLPSSISFEIGLEYFDSFYLFLFC